MLSAPALAQAREHTLESTADEISRLLNQTNASKAAVERALGHRRSTGRVDRMLRGDDFKFSSLAELAAVAGKRVIVSFKDVRSEVAHE